MNELIKWAVVGAVAVVAVKTIFKPGLPTTQTSYSLLNLGLGSGVG